ncbi:MAG: TonB-dependent receptor domain-containing protein, partial [Bryobacteraceae bacterium]
MVASGDHHHDSEYLSGHPLPGISQPVALGNEDSFAGADVQGAQQAVASYVHIFSPRLLNEARHGFNRFAVNYLPEGAAPGLNLGNSFGIPNSNTAPLQTAFPVVSPANYEGIGQSRLLPIIRYENTYQFVDNLTYTLGQHTLKFGEDYCRQITEYQTNQGNGRFNFSPNYTNLPGNSSGGDSMASFLLGLPTVVQQDFVLAYPGLRGCENGLYLADDWRVTSRLTLNLGLRWEYFSPYSEVANRIANFNPATAAMMIAGTTGVSDFANVQPDWKDFAPRFGFAYQVRSHTVVRGGFGLFYNPNGNGGASLRLERTAPYGPVYLVTTGDLFPGQTFSQGLPTA